RRDGVVVSGGARTDSAAVGATGTCATITGRRVTRGRAPTTVPRLSERFDRCGTGREPSVTAGVAVGTGNFTVTAGAGRVGGTLRRLPRHVHSVAGGNPDEHGVTVLVHALDHVVCTVGGHGLDLHRPTGAVGPFTGDCVTDPQRPRASRPRPTRGGARCRATGAGV